MGFWEEGTLGPVQGLVVHLYRGLVVGWSQVSDESQAYGLRVLQGIPGIPVSLVPVQVPSPHLLLPAVRVVVLLPAGVLGAALQEPPLPEAGGSRHLAGRHDHAGGRYSIQHMPDSSV